MKIEDFINGEVTYDKFGGQYFWINMPRGGVQMLAEMRGWGAIQNRFICKDGTIDINGAGKFQDELGDWIAEAINEKWNVKNKLNKITNEKESKEHSSNRKSD